jgi:hypothetical protein
MKRGADNRGGDFSRHLSCEHSLGKIKVLFLDTETTYYGSTLRAARFPCVGRPAVRQITRSSPSRFSSDNEQECKTNFSTR